MVTVLFIMALGGLIISVSEIIGRRKRQKRAAEKDHNIKFRRRFMRLPSDEVGDFTSTSFPNDSRASPWINVLWSHQTEVRGGSPL